MKAQVIKLPKDCQLVEEWTKPSQAGALPGGVSTNTEQEDWVEEVLDDGMASMLNIQFDNLIVDKESDLSCL